MCISSHGARVMMRGRLETGCRALNSSSDVDAHWRSSSSLEASYRIQCWLHLQGHIFLRCYQSF